MRNILKSVLIIVFLFICAKNIQAKAPDAEQCQSDLDCEVGNCREVAPNINVCSAPGRHQSGQFCNEQSDCLSGKCIIANLWQDDQVRICQGPGLHPTGSFCRFHTDCDEGVCRNRGDGIGLCQEVF